MANITSQVGNASLSVTATATGAIAGATVQFIDVALGRPVQDAMEDMCNAFGIRRDNQYKAGTGRPKQKLQFAGADVVMHLTFLQNGVHDGHSVVIVDVP